jgi:hypothetical protein
MPDLDLDSFVAADAERGRAELAKHTPHPDYGFCTYDAHTWPCLAVRCYLAGRADAAREHRPPARTRAKTATKTTTPS